MLVRTTTVRSITATADAPALSNTTELHMATYSDILGSWNFYELQDIAVSFDPTTVDIPGEPEYLFRKEKAAGILNRRESVR